MPPASARYRAAGFASQRDDRPASAGLHEADGVALGASRAESIETRPGAVGGAIHNHAN